MLVAKLQTADFRALRLIEAYEAGRGDERASRKRYKARLQSKFAKLWIILKHQEMNNAKMQSTGIIFLLLFRQLVLNTITESKAALENLNAV